MLDFAKIFSIFLLALLSTVSRPALAEDAGVKTPADASRHMVWSGAYIGFHVGGQNVEVKSSFSAAAYSSSSSANNFLGGTLAGYNWQTGTWVVGVEGDWSLIDNRAYLPSLFTLRGRAGWVNDNLLFYLTAGVGTKNGYVSRGILSGGTFQTLQLNSQQAVGPVAGGGVEMMLPYHLSARAEGLYYFESPRYDFAAFSFNGLIFPATTVDSKQQHFIYRASLIYYFD